MRLGIRSSPQDFRLGFFRALLADGLIRAGRYEEALDEAHTACRRDGGFFLPRIVGAWSLVKLARLDEARAMLSEAHASGHHSTAIRSSASSAAAPRRSSTRSAADGRRRYVCFSSLRMPSSPVTQLRAERHQICRFGIS